MIQQKNSKILKLIMVVVIITLLSANMWALVWANASSKAYLPNGEKSVAIESYVVTGAGGFLQSYSYMMLFLNKIELSEYNGLDYTELQSVLNNAIENMKDAKTAYVDLTREAGLLPYNPQVIAALAAFNYNDFKKANDLNHSVFSEVQEFLKNGDVRGIYKKILSDIEGILNMLTIIKGKIDAGQFPDLSGLYRMNQSYSHASLFGQYVAEVFMEIKK
jgi:hypothetical protein